MSEPRATTQAGFSLIEALLATALLSLIATTAVVLFTGFFNSRAAQDNLTALTEKTLRLRSILGDDLAHAVIRPHGLEGNVHLFSGDTTNNCFLSFARDNAVKGQVSTTSSKIESVLYCLNGRQIVRYAYHEADATKATKRRNYVVIGDIGDVKIRFFDGKRWQRQWLMGIENGRFFGRYSRLPHLVELSWTPSDIADPHDAFYRNHPIRQRFALPPRSF